MTLETRHPLTFLPRRRFKMLFLKKPLTLMRRRLDGPVELLLVVRHLATSSFLVATSKALVTSSDALCS